jgi:probable HAF family extracellular repeat protein
MALKETAMSCKIALLVAAGLALSVNAASAQVRYIPVPVPDASYALNNAGQVAGVAPVTLPFSHAFLWTDGVRTDLGTLGGNMSRGFGLNDSGHVVGGAAVGPEDFTPWHAFLYRDTAMRDLGTLGGSTSEAAAANANDQVTGYATTALEKSHAFRYSGGVMQDLGTLDGDSSRGTDINSAGEVVGVSGGHAFLYSNVLRDFGAPLGYSLARAINDRGQVVGLSGTSDFDGHAFLYADGAMQDLGTLGGSFSAAFDINNLGQVVGWTDVAGVDGRLAFIYADGVMRTIDSLIYGATPLRFSMAYAINDRQQILAGACDAYRCGTYRLDPVPEPAALFLLAPGLLLLAFAARLNGTSAPAPSSS